MRDRSLLYLDVAAAWLPPDPDPQRKVDEGGRRVCQRFVAQQHARNGIVLISEGGNDTAAQRQSELEEPCRY